MRGVLTLFVLTAVVEAAQVPFQIPSSWPEETGLTSHGSRIAIIGGGAGGSSSAFWLEQAKSRFGLDIDVHVFEKEDRIGGSECLELLLTNVQLIGDPLGTTVIYPLGDKSRKPMELGASIFVEANKIMHRATREFGLELDTHEMEEETGVWDGEKFVVRVISFNLFPNLLSLTIFILVGREWRHLGLVGHSEIAVEIWISVCNDHQNARSASHGHISFCLQHRHFLVLHRRIIQRSQFHVRYRKDRERLLPCSSRWTFIR